MILTGDIGGTNARFALFTGTGNHLEMTALHRYDTKSLKSLEDAAVDFLRRHNLWQSGDIQAAWFSLAGPVSGDTCRFTNLDLTVDLTALRRRLTFIPEIGMCNDLVALGYGIPLLPDQSFLLLSGKKSLNFKEEPLNKAVIAPGTGLGESLLIRGEVYPTEGSHADFAPQAEEDLKLWRFLHQQFGHVSYERILSGTGLANVYRFLWEGKKLEGCSGTYPQFLSPAQISTKALAKTCPLCMAALHTFVRILGAEAGNLALKSFARGGVYLGGGIPPKIKDKLTDGTFWVAFTDKGRFSKFLEDIPVYLILEENAPLLGAAWLAIRQISGDKTNSLIVQTPYTV